MTAKQIDTKIQRLKNKIERACQKPDPTGEIIASLEREIARLEAMKRA